MHKKERYTIIADSEPDDREVMSVPLKIMLGAFIFLVGWLWYYLFLRQFVYNFTTAFPLIRKMRSLNEDLINPNANRYTAVSVFASLALSLVIAAIVVFLCRKHFYYIIAFGAGALIACLMTLNKISIRNRAMFDAFCNAYYRFLPDDELRTAMYNKDIHKMKLRLHEMGISVKDSFIPDFKD